MRPIYDTKEGIASYLTDLEGINRLSSDRRTAGYDRGERMQEWVVLGRWRLSTNGNFDPIVARYDGGIPAEMGKCPAVMSMDETYLFLRGGSLTSSSSWPFPKHYCACKTCGKLWTLENCHDFQTSQDSDEGAISLADFVGQPLSSVTKIPALVNKVVHFVGHDAVYNDNLPDPPEDAEKDYRRENTRLSRSKKKWHYVDKDYIIQEGDHAMMQYVHFEHRGCQQHRATLEEREAVVEAFAKAGYPKINLLTQPNGYCKDKDCKCTPWFLAQVNNEVPLTIGWRKSVIHVDWSASGKKLPDLFDGEEVTKSPEYIHAWGYDKLAEYLGKLMPALGVQP